MHYQYQVFYTVHLRTKGIPVATTTAAAATFSAWSMAPIYNPLAVATTTAHAAATAATTAATAAKHVGSGMYGVYYTSVHASTSFALHPRHLAVRSIKG